MEDPRQVEYKKALADKIIKAEKATKKKTKKKK